MEEKAVKNSTSFLKSLIWRIMGVIVLGTVTYYFTQHWVITTKITLVHHAFFLLVFYLHERMWTHISKPTGTVRHIVKALCYEICGGMVLGGLINFMFTHSWPIATQITLTYTAIKLVMYYFYDKLWPELKD
jgi:uncharacterized membrane protein